MDALAQLPLKPLAAAEIDAFKHDGFLTVRQVAGVATVAVIRSRIAELFARQAGRREGAFFDFSGTDEDGAVMGLPQLLDVRSYAPKLIATDFFGYAEFIARQLLGPAARFVADHALMKPALHGAGTPWHQDDAFREGIYQHNEISIWLALQETNEENGCLGFVGGSHLGPVLPHRPLRGDNKVHALECYAGWRPAEVTLCPLDAGDCTVHTNRTLHGAGPNVSALPRFGYVLVFATPPRRMAAPYQHDWLAEKQELRLQRRRVWMLRGGLVVHGWRRMKQIQQIGAREFTRRLLSRLG